MFCWKAAGSGCCEDGDFVDFYISSGALAGLLVRPPSRAQKGNNHGVTPLESAMIECILSIGQVHPMTSDHAEILPCFQGLSTPFAILGTTPA